MSARNGIFAGVLFATLAVVLLYFSTFSSDSSSRPPGQVHVAVGTGGLRPSIEKPYYDGHGTTKDQRQPSSEDREVERKVTRIIEIESKKSPADASNDGAGGSSSGAVDQTPPAPIETEEPKVNPVPVHAMSDLPRFPAEARQLGCKACFRHGAQMGTRTCLPSACSAFPATGKRVVSTSLYGADKRYTDGALRNCELAAVVFPGWQLRFYLKNDVPQAVQAEMRALGADLHVLADTSSVGFGMNWRFLVAEDASVDAFVSRDCDSRLSLRDRYAVEEWMDTGKPFHVVRDHPSHAALAIMGGTWGARNFIWGSPPKGTGKNLKSRLQDFVSKTGEGGYMADIGFLEAEVWPMYASNGASQHDTHTCKRWGGGAYPRPRAGLEHVGAVYLWDDAGHEHARAGDCQLLIGNTGTAECASPGYPARDRKALSLTSAVGEAASVAVSELLSCSEGGDEVHPGSAGKYGCVASWKQTTGMCKASGRVRVLHWRDSFIDGVLQTNEPVALAGTSYTSLFTYSRHTFVGVQQGAPSLPAPPAQYHERVSSVHEPIQSYDGGVRYYPSLAVIDAPWVFGGQADQLQAQALAFAMEDLPRLLQVAPPETIVLLPPAAAQAVRSALSSMSSDDVPAALSSQFSPSALSTHIVDQQSGPAILHYARDAFVYGCEE